MKIKNRVQAAERLKHILNGYIQGAQLMNRELYINCEDDSDIAEWTDEELEKGDGYLSIMSVDLYANNQIHMNTVGYISNLLELPVSIEERSEEFPNEYPYEISVYYKGYRFFDLYTTEEYEAEKHLFYKGDNKTEALGIRV